MRTLDKGKAKLVRRLKNEGEHSMEEAHRRSVGESAKHLRLD